MRSLAFALVCLFIALASAADHWALVRYGPMLEACPGLELNPLCRWIIVQAGVPLLAAAKLFFTSAVLIGLAFCRSWRPHMAAIVAAALAGFQAGLLWFLFT